MNRAQFLITIILLTISINGCNSQSKDSGKVTTNGCNSQSKDSGKVTTTLESQVESKYLNIKKLSAVFFDQKIWSNYNEDLNGDGTNDKIEIYSTKEYLNNHDEPNEYMLNVCINDICYNQKVNFSQNSYFGKETKFEVIDINKKDNLKELLISYNEANQEDPSFNHSIFRFLNDDIITVSEVFSSGYSNGQINYLDDYSFTVDHSRFPDIKGTYKLDGLYLKQSDLYIQPEDEVDYSKMAACPFVYLVDDQNKIYKGEILRYLNTEYTETWQKLDLKLDAKIYSKLKICISEEKDETTYLNSVYLNINGKVHTPKLITSDIRKIISDDDKYVKLSKGEIIELHFDFEPELIKTCVLQAKGYYIPNEKYISLNNSNSKLTKR
jgi:hypothetical protein